MRTAALLLSISVAVFGAKKQTDVMTPLEKYVAESDYRRAAAPQPTPGAIWSPGSLLADTARDLRASQVDDVLTIVVAENASALASGSTKTQRTSSTNNSLTKLAGVTRATGPWANLASLSGDSQLSGQGSTGRDMAITATLTARVAAILPNGGLVIEGFKDVQVNSERQTISVRGVVRQADIGPSNTVSSDRLGQLELKVNGKGVVGDAIRRPFILYRLLLGLLPF
jgi:flagellar L-ring protein precursor FlgH